MLWENLREPEFKESVKISKGVCAVPIGCLERHGPHAPLGTDTIIAAGVAAAAAEIEPVVVFPTMFFGDKTGTRDWAGHVIFSLETRWAIFKETCNEIYRNGFNKIIFCNGHGGNTPMLGTFTRAMMQENPNVMTFVRSTSADCSGAANMQALLDDKEHFQYLTAEDRAAMQDFIDKKKVTGHACFSETARAYAFRPETVRLDLINSESGDSIHRFDELTNRKISSPYAWMADYPNSYTGANDYVLNERIAKAMAEKAAMGLAEVFKFLKEETITNEYQAEWIKKQ